MSRLTQVQRVKAFGNPGDAGEVRLVRTPWYLPGGKEHIQVWVHRHIEEVLLHSMAHAVRPAWTPQRIDSYNPRKIRGSTNWSLHSWGLAFDFFATPPGVPPPGGVWKPHDHVTHEFAEAFEMHGFSWGRHWEREDWPHIEWAGPPP